MSLTFGILMGFATMLLWGVGDYLQAIPLKKLGTYKVMLFTNGVSFIAVLAFLLVFLMRGGIHMALTDVPLFLILGVLNLIGIYYFFRSFELGELSIVSPIVSAYPAVTVMLSITFIHELLTPMRIIAVVVILIGIVLASTDIRRLRHIHGVKGVKEAAISLISYGVFFFLMGPLAKTMDLMSLMILSFIFLDGMVVAFSILKGGSSISRGWHFRETLPILCIVSATGIMAWALFNVGIRTEQVSIVTTLGSLGSVITVVLATIFMKDRLVFNQKIGVALTLLGIFLISI